MRYQKQDAFSKKLQNYLSSIMMKQEDLRKLTSLFRMLDTNNDGNISREELLEGMKAWPQSSGAAMTADEASELFESLDDN